MYKRLIVAASLVGIALFVINLVAHALYWYVSIPWFDMLMHTIGGMFTALVASAGMVRVLETLPRRDMFITILLAVFIIGLGWEYYEYIVQYYIKAVHLADLADSISDIICDMIGGILGACFVILIQKRYNRSQ